MENIVFRRPPTRLYRPNARRQAVFVDFGLWAPIDVVVPIGLPAGL
jgi:hypothetical protein